MFDIKKSLCHSGGCNRNTKTTNTTTTNNTNATTMPTIMFGIKSGEGFGVDVGGIGFSALCGWKPLIFSSDASFAFVSFVVISFVLTGGSSSVSDLGEVEVVFVAAKVLVVSNSVGVGRSCTGSLILEGFILGFFGGSVLWIFGVEHCATADGGSLAPSSAPPHHGAANHGTF